MTPQQLGFILINSPQDTKVVYHCSEQGDVEITEVRVRPRNYNEALEPVVEVA